MNRSARTAAKAPPLWARPGVPAPAARAWGLPHYLALIGVPILILEVWTITAWMLDGPYQITQYRSGTHSYEWWGARILEALAIGISLVVIRRMIRNCRAQRKVFTFDVMFCLAASTQFWASGVTNYFLPMFTYNSEFINLNDPCGHIPLMVNPDCGRIPNSIVFIWLTEVFVLLGAAMVLGNLLGWLRNRYAHLSRAKLISLLFLVGCLVVLAEPLIIIPLHGWTFPGAPLSITIGSSGMRYPIFPEMIAFSLYLVFPTCLRYFKDDKGRTIVERGLEHHGPRTRFAVTMMALYTFFQFLVWVPGTAPNWPLGFYQRTWGTIPPSLNNGLCDQPGIVEDTRYGPCPGTPGFRMPISGSLPGRSP